MPAQAAVAMLVATLFEAIAYKSLISIIFLVTRAYGEVGGLALFDTVTGPDAGSGGMRC